MFHGGRDKVKTVVELLALARDVGDRAGEAAALTGLASLATFMGDVARGNALAEQSLAVYRELGDIRGLADVLFGLGMSARNAGNYERAQELGEEALDLFRALGDTGHMAEALWSLGLMAQHQGRYERAVRLIAAAATLRDSIASPLPPHERDARDRTVTWLQQSLGDELFAAAWEAGRAIGLAQAITDALEDVWPPW